MTRATAAARGPLLAACALVSACALRHDMAAGPSCDAAEGIEVRWWSPAGPEDRAANAARCETVGRPVLLREPAPAFGDLLAGDSIAVFSWNVAVGGGDLHAFLRDQVGLTCSGRASRPGPGFTHVIILLQEAHRHSDALPPVDDPRLAGSPAHHPHPSREDRDAVETAALCGLAAAYVPSGRNGADRPGQRRLDKGNAILSSLHLDNLVAVEAPFETERKVAVAAEVPLPGGQRLRVVAVHLDVVTNFGRALLSGNQNRTRQIRGVLLALDSLERREGRAPPTLVGGDFNTWSGFEGALRVLRSAFPDSPRWDGQGTRGPFPTDHLFFRRGTHPLAEVTVLPDSYQRLDIRHGSDHEPVFLRLRLGEDPARRP